MGSMGRIGLMEKSVSTELFCDPAFLSQSINDKIDSHFLLRFII
jgi:hypothetical protein